jgi:beta-mannanase
MVVLLIGITSFSYFLYIMDDKQSQVEASQRAYIREFKSEILGVAVTPSSTPSATPTPIKTASPAATLKPSPSATATASASAKPKPPVSTKFSLPFGVAMDDYANSNGSITSLESALGRKVEVLSIFKQFGLPGNKDLDSGALNFAKSNNKKLLIAWEPWNPEEGMNQSKDYLKAIISGEMDGYIDSFASGVKSFGGPVELRFGHEMNGDWYPWGNRPDDYVAAYKHVVDQFRKDGVSNVTWMWCINAESVPSAPISDAKKFYPGDSYVDVIGIDGFNFGQSNWRTFSQVFNSSYNFAASFHKKISLAETASGEEGGNKPQWVDGMFTTVLQNYPQVYELVWFNILKERDWRINSTQSSQAKFTSWLSK